MKKTKLLIFGMAFASFAISVQAQKAYEGFSVLDTVNADEANGWADGWARIGGAGNPGIATEGMNYQGASKGSAVILKNNIFTRTLSGSWPDAEGVSYWVGVLEQVNTPQEEITSGHNGCFALVDALKGGGEFLYLGTRYYDGSESTETWSILGGPTDWQDVTSVDYAKGEAVWFVARIDMSGDESDETAYIWINPDTTLNDLDPSTADFTRPVRGFNGGFEYVYMSSNNFEMQFDEIRLGTSWADVNLRQIPDGISQNKANQLSLSATPNPVSLTSEISYVLATAQNVKLSVVDMMGKEVAVIADGNQAAGKQTVIFSAEGLASGIYICKLQAGSEVSTKSMVVRK